MAFIEFGKSNAISWPSSYLNDPRELARLQMYMYIYIYIYTYILYHILNQARVIADLICINFFFELRREDTYINSGAFNSCAWEGKALMREKTRMHWNWKGARYQYVASSSVMNVVWVFVSASYLSRTLRYSKLGVAARILEISFAPCSSVSLFHPFS